MKIEIQASSLALSPEELRQNLSPEAMTAIQGKRIHPWIVGETGTSQPRDLKSGGNRRLHWARRAIQALARAVKAGTKLFRNHGAGTNSHDGRESVGEVVGTFERALPDGRFQAVAVGVLDSEMPELDVCSIEAEIDITESGDVVDVASVSAVALGDSQVDSPAFPGAQRLASMQFFDNNDEKKTKGDVEVTLNEVKDWITERGIHPSKLFTPDDIREDTRFAGLMSDSREAVARAEKAEKELGTATKKIEEITKTGAENAVKVVKAEGRKALADKLPEGTTDAQKKFLIDRFNPAGPEDVEDGALESYIDNGTKEFADLAKLIGGSDNPTGGSEDGSDAGGDAKDKLLAAITG